MNLKEKDCVGTVTAFLHKRNSLTSTQWHEWRRKKAFGSCVKVGTMIRRERPPDENDTFVSALKNRVRFYSTYGLHSSGWRIDPIPYAES